jgi:uncharacterized membrane protein
VRNRPALILVTLLLDVISFMAGIALWGPLMVVVVFSEGAVPYIPWIRLLAAIPFIAGSLYLLIKHQSEWAKLIAGIPVVGDG